MDDTTHQLGQSNNSVTKVERVEYYDIYASITIVNDFEDFKKMLLA